MLRKDAMPRWPALALLASCIVAGCSPSSPPVPLAGKVRAFVSIMPHAWLLERVGGDDVDVHVMVQPGQSPHSYEPTPQQMAALAEAQVYFLLGVPFEKALKAKMEKTHKSLLLVDTCRGLTLRRMEHPDHHEEEHTAPAGAKHGHDHDHEAGALDPHTWLDPMMVKAQARVMAEELSRLAPARADALKTRLAAVEADLDAVDRRIAAALAPVKGGKFYVFHPAFGYFGDRYGLKQEPVEIEGKEPGPQQLAALIEAARKDKVRVIFVQPQFSRRSAEAVAKAIGGGVVPLDTLARDYLANLEDMAARLRQALEGQASK
jgi:zinc transport system substrate-binding protein